jgi:hypothetical protein
MRHGSGNLEIVERELFVSVAGSIVFSLMFLGFWFGMHSYAALFPLVMALLCWVGVFSKKVVVFNPESKSISITETSLWRRSPKTKDLGVG